MEKQQAGANNAVPRNLRPSVTIIFFNNLSLLLSSFFLLLSSFFFLLSSFFLLPFSFLFLLSSFFFCFFFLLFSLFVLPSSFFLLFFSFFVCLETWWQALHAHLCSQAVPVPLCCSERCGLDGQALFLRWHHAGTDENREGKEGCEKQMNIWLQRDDRDQRAISKKFHY